METLLLGHTQSYSWHRVVPVMAIDPPQGHTGHCRATDQKPATPGQGFLSTRYLALLAKLVSDETNFNSMIFEIFLKILS